MAETLAGAEPCVYLSEVSRKDKPWEEKKATNEQLQSIFESSQHEAKIARLQQCSVWLGFGWAALGDSGELALKLKTANFCRVRGCPICDWRIAMKWRARAFEALPKVQQAYPDAAWLFLTLTVKNCPVEQTRATLQDMAQGWKNLMKLKDFPAIGYIRSTEITKGADSGVHPHFHILMMVKPSYFKKGYLSQANWTEKWQSCCRLNYTPIVHVKRVKTLKLESESDSESSLENLLGAILETCKYSVKGSDLVGDSSEAEKEWTIELLSQIHKLRLVTVGGVIKQFMKDDEPDDLIGTDNTELIDDINVNFRWKTEQKKYQKTDR